MNKEFCTYEQSLALKELGFDEPTLYHWHNADKSKPFTNEICSPTCRPSTNLGIKEIGEENHVWSAPLKQQAFRWFREKYGLESFVDRGGARGIYHAFVGGSEHGWLYGNNGNRPSEFTYEEAEDACIDKLIEIVKQKQ